MVDTPGIPTLAQDVAQHRELVLEHIAQLRARLSLRETIRAHSRSAIIIAFAGGFAAGWLLNRPRSELAWVP